MFDHHHTVIVTGAGASWHYGYPTGEELIQDVIWCAERLNAYCMGRLTTALNLHEIPRFMMELKLPNDANLSPWQQLQLHCNDLISRLRSVEPVVIDYFLGWNPHLQNLGRMLIAGALLQRECRGAGKWNYNRWLAAAKAAEPGRGAWDRYPYHQYSDNWLRFVVHQLLVGCAKSEQLLNNKVNFITFNYDNSLRNGLAAALAQVQFLEKPHIDTFLNGNRIVHMYGQLRDVGKVEDIEKIDLAFQDNTRLDKCYKATEIFHLWLEASQDIRVIDPHDKNQNEAVQMARTLMSGADRFYFLGFGFDSNNMERLGLPLRPEGGRAKATFFTNYHDFATVNRRAYRAFRQNADHSASFSHLNNISAYKSERDVYQAINLDFGHFES